MSIREKVALKRGRGAHMAPKGQCFPPTFHCLVEVVGRERIKISWHMAIRVFAAVRWDCGVPKWNRGKKLSNDIGVWDATMHGLVLIRELIGKRECTFSVWCKEVQLTAVMENPLLWSKMLFCNGGRKGRIGNKEGRRTCSEMWDGTAYVAEVTGQTDNSLLNLNLISNSNFKTFCCYLVGYNWEFVVNSM